MKKTMTGYQQRYEAECSKCGRTIRTKAPETVHAGRGVEIRCRGTGCDCESLEECDCEQCGHINHTKTEIPHEQEEKGRFKGVFS